MRIVTRKPFISASACRPASVQPSGEAASNSRARQRSGSGPRRRRWGWGMAWAGGGWTWSTAARITTRHRFEGAHVLDRDLKGGAGLQRRRPWCVISSGFFRAHWLPAWHGTILANIFANELVARFNQFERI